MGIARRAMTAMKPPPQIKGSNKAANYGVMQKT
jgi:hypothetical protein